MTSHGDLWVNTLLRRGGLGKSLFLIHSDWISMKTLSHDTLRQSPASQTLNPSHSVFTMAACQKDFSCLGPQDSVLPWKSARPIPVLCRGWWAVFQHGLTFMGTAILNMQIDHMQNNVAMFFEIWLSDWSRAVTYPVCCSLIGWGPRELPILTSTIIC